MPSPSRVVALFAVGVIIVGCSKEAAKEQEPPKDVVIAGVDTFGPQARDHVDSNVAYAQTPPVGGIHNPRWQNCGIYDQPIRKEMGVHSMEHGAVWITYRPNLPAADVEKLRSVVKGWPFTLLTPYPDLTKPIYASAWGLQMAVDSASDPRLPQFVAKYAMGPQTPEPGAPCSNSEGKPIG